MRRHLEHVALPRLLAPFHSSNLLANRYQRIAEAVELLLALALRGLNHERVRHRPRHSRGMESVVLKTLRHVDGLDARRVLELADIEDEFVGAAAVVVRVDDGVVWLEAREDVVCVEEGYLRGLREADGAHHLDVGPADGQDARAAPGGAADGVDGFFAACFGAQVAREEGCEV